MRLLIDGYNLMYAGGLLGKPLGPDAFRRVRTRFLNDLADALGAVDAHATTVVFDASRAPAGVPRESGHKGIDVVYAVDEESADDRIEALLRGHSNPTTVTVVSTDRRVREAARRRRATAVTSEEFWTRLDALKERKRRGKAPKVPVAARPVGPPGPPDDDAEHWLREFGHLDELPEVREALAPDSGMLTDADVDRIAREVEREPG